MPITQKVAFTPYCLSSARICGVWASGPSSKVSATSREARLCRMPSGGSGPVGGEERVPSGPEPSGAGDAGESGPSLSSMTAVLAELGVWLADGLDDGLELLLLWGFGCGLTGGLFRAVAWSGASPPPPWPGARASSSWWVTLTVRFPGVLAGALTKSSAATTVSSAQGRSGLRVMERLRGVESRAAMTAFTLVKSSPGGTSPRPVGAIRGVSTSGSAWVAVNCRPIARLTRGFAEQTPKPLPGRSGQDLGGRRERGWPYNGGRQCLVLPPGSRGGHDQRPSPLREYRRELLRTGRRPLLRPDQHGGRAGPPHGGQQRRRRYPR